VLDPSLNLSRYNFCVQRQPPKGSQRLKPSSLLAFTAAALLAAAVTIAAQDQPAAQPAAPAASGSPGAPQGPGGPRNYPAPKNLKVLPKDSTGREVHETMEKWAGSLGVHCDTCHVADPKNIGPNGRPRLKFDDDSKADKQIARIMYTMTEQMNADYIKKAMDLDKDGEGTPVTCGTCHRGHKMPETYVIPKEDQREGRGGMPGMPGMAPPTSSAPPSN
jgi:Photosynthetic reaction centre cytochrome C subunit